METAAIGEEVAYSETLKTIYERRAVRKYKEIPVDHELITKVLDAGRMAPSAINRQPWKFYILTGKETIKTFSKEIAKVTARTFVKTHSGTDVLKTAIHVFHMLKEGDLFKRPDPIFHGAPVVVFIAAPRDNEWAPIDIGMCAQNMMLAAKALGLDSCPVGLAKYVEQTRIFSRLQVPLSEQVHMAIILGYGDEMPEAHQRIRNNAFFIE
ncbi:MAG: nitroreductase [Bacteroidetes bacterium]|nr:nitroreductase [Bacteroidota bacterium]